MAALKKRRRINIFWRVAHTLNNDSHPGLRANQKCYDSIDDDVFDLLNINGLPDAYTSAIAEREESPADAGDVLDVIAYFGGFGVVRWEL